MRIIGQFPLLKVITIEQATNERIMHQICNQFVGKICLESISTSSDLIVPGALCCSMLKRLSLGYQSSRTGLVSESPVAALRLASIWDHSTKTIRPHERRDVAALLQNFPHLEHLEIGKIRLSR
jgi:hypothetical protein